jgi:hypothetical protein
VTFDIGGKKKIGNSSSGWQKRKTGVEDLLFCVCVPVKTPSGRPFRSVRQVQGRHRRTPQASR